MTSKKASSQEVAETTMKYAGVPEPVLRYVLEQRPAMVVNTLYHFFTIFIMVLGFGYGAVLWGAIEEISNSNAISFSKSVGALLYEDIFGLSMLIVLFAWISSMSFVYAVIERLHPRMAASVFVFGHLEDKALRVFKFREFLKSLHDITEPAEYLAAVRKRKYRWAVLPTIVLLAFVPYFFDRELDAYSAFTAEGFYSKPLLPWQGDQSGNWSGVLKVELGCNHITGRNASDDIIYRVWIADDLALHLSAASTVSGNFLDHLETIDNTLKHNNIRFQRWEWLGRNPLHPACLEAQNKFYSPSDVERIYRLLQVGAFPSD